ncbi:hypothetical protein [Actinoplanes cyaneus]|nr:hypothetical protein [Actinoplanes cyaneus]MCW2136778.1 hypothetical protein [Actinoplanes cyaneus]
MARTVSVTWERVDAEDDGSRACPSVDRPATPRLLTLPSSIPAIATPARSATIPAVATPARIATIPAVATPARRITVPARSIAG